MPSRLPKTGLWVERAGPSFWAGARGLDVLLGVPFLWAWRVGLRAHFPNPISWNRLAKSSYHVEFRQISRQSEFHVLRGNESDGWHVVGVEWLTLRHMSSCE